LRPRGIFLLAIWALSGARGASAQPTITEYPLPTAASNPTAIIKGSDGNLWFVETAANKIGKITTAGAITEFAIPTPNSGLAGITTGPDGNIWFTESTGNKIGKIAADGSITEYPLPTANSLPTSITAGPDGNGLVH
jgi:virginiamycin B lyase